jgi:hypothetical protein
MQVFFGKFTACSVKPYVFYFQTLHSLEETQRLGSKQFSIKKTNRQNTGKFKNFQVEYVGNSF